MSFCEQLAIITTEAIREYDAAREIETQRMTEEWMAKVKKEFMEKCECEARNRSWSMELDVLLPRELSERKGKMEMVKLLRAMLKELGFSKGGRVSQPTYALTGSLWIINAKISVTWGAARPSPCNTPEKSLEKGGGTYVTCPICQEHGPVVALVPCGHVLCRECEHQHQKRQPGATRCPFCRQVTTSATKGLFLD
eukprot:symbB.v1.2.022151.t1/scaffold1953.1/size126199/2